MTTPPPEFQYHAWTPDAAPPPDFQVGQTVLGVKIERILQGGMGVVYLGHSAELDMPVALKSYRLDWPSEAAFQTFQDEAAIWIKMGTAASHVVRAWSYHLLDERPFILMEYVDGGDLQSRLEAAGGCLRIDEALDVALQFCSGMVYLRDHHQVVHGDIKPANVLFESGGHLRISDFGLAGVVGQVHGGAGTYPFMPPEQWDRDSIIGTGADVYAFGMMFYVMLTGFTPLPFASAATAEEFRTIHETAPYLPLAALSPQREEVLEALDTVISRCLDKDPRRRWPDFAALFTQLERLHQRFMGFAWTDTVPEGPTMTSHVEVRQGQMELAQGDAESALARAEVVLKGAEAIKDIEGLVFAGEGQALVLKQDALFSLERYQEALEVNDQLLRYAPDNPSICLARANILLYCNRIGSALNELNNLAGSEVDYVQMFILRATAYLALGLNQLAAQTAGEIQLMDPESPEARRILDLANESSEPGETDPTVLRRFFGQAANEHLRAEEYVDAEELALLALNFEHHPDEANLLVAAQIMSNKLRQAEATARDLVERYSTRPDCWYNLAQVLVLLEEKTEAREILERLHEHDPDDELVNQLLAEVTK